MNFVVCMCFPSISRYTSGQTYEHECMITQVCVSAILNMFMCGCTCMCLCVGLVLCPNRQAEVSSKEKNVQLEISVLF